MLELSVLRGNEATFTDLLLNNLAPDIDVQQFIDHARLLRDYYVSMSTR